MDDFPTVFIDTKAASLKAFKQQAKIHAYERENLLQRQIDAETLGFALHSATVPTEAKVRYSFSDFANYITVTDIESFDDATEILSVLDSLLPSWSPDRPRPQETVEDATVQKQWIYTSTTVGWIYLKVILGKETMKCKIIKTTTEKYIPADTISEENTEIVCPGDPRYDQI